MKIPERLQLARTPLLVQFLAQTSKKVGKNISLWRIDLTGLEFSGNKIRKWDL